MMRSRRFRTDYYGYLFLVPFIVAFLIFGLYPVVNTVLLSFTNTTLMGAQASFVGLKNYTRLFADDVFPTAIKNTWLLWILNFIPQIGIAMLLSVWFTNARLRVRGVGAWRALFYLPNLLMPAAVAALFFSLFSYFGPVNQFLGSGRFHVRGKALLAGSDGCTRIGHLHPVVDVVRRYDHHPDGRDDLHFHFPL